MAKGAAWSLGDDPGNRRFVDPIGESSLQLDLGGSLGPLTVAYEAWGEPTSARDNAVLIEHALTGDSHAVRPGGPRPPHVRAGGTPSLGQGGPSTPTGGG